MRRRSRTGYDADGVRVEVDRRSESVGRKIRDAELAKVPFMLVVGDREREAEQVTVRAHGAGGGNEAMTPAEFAALLRRETAPG